ncbi:MAG: hypothetical protein E7214_00395 [Clostridium sp.]|nr:hypothetical protein [Clostridium sp.]
MSSDSIRIDSDKLATTIAYYSTAISKLEKAKSDISNGINIANRGWKGEAKDAFNNVKNADWKKGLSEQIDRIKFLRDELKEVKRCYDDIQSKSTSI